MLSLASEMPLSAAVAQPAMAVQHECPCSPHPSTSLSCVVIDASSHKSEADVTCRRANHWIWSYACVPDALQVATMVA